MEDKFYRAWIIVGTIARVIELIVLLSILILILVALLK